MCISRAKIASELSDQSLTMLLEGTTPGSGVEGYGEVGLALGTEEDSKDVMQHRTTSCKSTLE